MAVIFLLMFALPRRSAQHAEGGAPSQDALAVDEPARSDAPARSDEPELVG
jgi:hypothetical protein